MKKTIYISIILALYSSCSKINDIESTFVNTQTFEYLIDAKNKPGLHQFEDKNINLNLDSLMLANNLKKEWLKSCQVSSVELELDDSLNYSFDDFEENNLILSNKIDSIKIINNKVLPKNRTSKIILPIGGFELKDYFKVNGTKLKYHVNIRNIPVNSTLLSMKINYLIRGTIVQ